jgi:hypothetical protein
MKASKTLIAWNGVEDTPARLSAPPGSIAIGPLLQSGEGDWAALYACTGGAAYSKRERKNGDAIQFCVYRDAPRLSYPKSLSIHCRIRE